MQTAVSQPLPFPSSLDDLLMFIADFGNDHITPYALRAPETILLGPWNQRVSVWTFECLLPFLRVFELITGQNLFKYEPYPDRSLDAAAGHLWQMICFTGKKFQPKQLSWSHRATQYYEKTTCMLSQSGSIENPYPFEMSLRNYKTIGEEDVLVTATSLRRCLRLDSDDRYSAEQLLDVPF
ncbi:hypothetical protein EDD18DRAFT_1307649 [Armillaria luteobubalina]|uniref:Uncharacterized protein n=1 Tax=Armillaria luteobubalina TaxID=153913 RepID=A0AA39URE7_9AGAR|nr:hypothetical protein EDD18DRAFT_1307649 [Armillaria luteobubalina]